MNIFWSHCCFTSTSSLFIALSTHPFYSCSAITSACIRGVPVDSDSVSEMVEGAGSWADMERMSSSVQAYATPFCHTATASGRHVFLQNYSLANTQKQKHSRRGRSHPKFLYSSVPLTAVRMSLTEDIVRSSTFKVTMKSKGQILFFIGILQYLL